ncbi:dynein regulatory complex subunit 2 [Aulostomus maculatus]
MPKKTKKIGGKTDEEKLLQLHQRVQADGETNRKREELLTLFLKDKLQKEERNTAVNLLKLNEGWRAILRQTQSAELQDDIDVFHQTFERQLDGLDSIIKSLAGDLGEAEHQSAQVWRLHLQCMERLRALQHQWLSFLQQQWEGGLQKISLCFISERKHMVIHSELQKVDFYDSTFTLEHQHSEMMSNIHRLYRDSMAGLQSTHQDRMAVLVRENVNKLAEKSHQNQEALQLFSSKPLMVKRLMSRNQHLIDLTVTEMKNVQQLQNNFIDLRMKLTATDTENISVTEGLTAIKSEMNRNTNNLQDQLTRAHTASRKQLTDLTIHSGEAIKKLQTVIPKGEKVLHIAEMCRKMETEQEHIFPSLLSGTKEDEMQKLEKGPCYFAGEFSAD